MLSKTKIELQNQLKANINAHQELLKLSKDIDETIHCIEKKLKKGGKVSKKKTKKPRGVGVAQRGYGKALTGKKK